MSKRQLSFSHFHIQSVTKSFLPTFHLYCYVCCKEHHHINTSIKSILNSGWPFKIWTRSCYFWFTLCWISEEKNKTKLLLIVLLSTPNPWNVSSSSVPLFSPAYGVFALFRLIPPHCQHSNLLPLHLISDTISSVLLCHMISIMRFPWVHPALSSCLLWYLRVENSLFPKVFPWLLHSMSSWFWINISQMR